MPDIGSDEGLRQRVLAVAGVTSVDTDPARERVRIVVDVNALQQPGFTDELLRALRPSFDLGTRFRSWRRPAP